jgi:hypothetical protein
VQILEDGVTTPVHTFTKTDGPIVLLGLKDNQRYTAVVTGINKAGSSPGVGIRFTQPSGACSPDSDPPSPVGGLTAAAGPNATRSIRLTWQRPTIGCASRFLLTASETNSGQSILSNASIEGTISSTGVEGLTANTTYTVSIIAVGVKGDMSAPSMVIFTTAAGCEQVLTSPPRVPEAVEARSQGQTITLSWQAPPDGSCATSYSVTVAAVTAEGNTT